MTRRAPGYHPTMAALRARVFLGDDRVTQHHAAAPAEMSVLDFEGTTDCGRSGQLQLIHDELVDMGELCEGCRAVTGVRPPLAGGDRGPV